MPMSYFVSLPTTTKKFQNSLFLPTPSSFVFVIPLFLTIFRHALTSNFQHHYDLVDQVEVYAVAERANFPPLTESFLCIIPFQFIEISS
jgi:hypothetical protein